MSLGFMMNPIFLVIGITPGKFFVGYNFFLVMKTLHSWNLHKICDKIKDNKLYLHNTIGWSEVFLVEYLNKKLILESLCFMGKHFLSDLREPISQLILVVQNLFKKVDNPNIIGKTIFEVKPSVFIVEFFGERLY